MKFFLIVFTILFCVTSYGKFFPVGKVGADTSYGKKSKCEQAEGQECFDISGKDLRHFIVGEVDDLDRQKYSKEDLQACSGPEDCQAKLEASDCAPHGEGSFAMINEDFSEMYCAKPNGYFKKPALVVDAAAKVQADADDAAKAADKATRASKRSQRKADAASCVAAVNAGGNMSAAQTKACVQVLIKEVFESDIQAADL